MLYIHLKQHIKLSGEIQLKDIAIIYSESKGTTICVEKVVIGFVSDNPIVVSVVDIARVITETFGNIQISFTGAQDCCILPAEKERSKPLKFIISLFLFLTLFVGGMATIIHFQADVDIPGAHKAIYKVITGKELDNPLIVGIPYALGIGIGVTVFCNMLPFTSNKKPTLLDLEQNKLQKELVEFYKNHEDVK